MAESKNPRSSSKTKTRKANTEVASEPAVVSDEEIAVKAYELWESRGRPLGSPDEDWHNALEQLRSGA